MVLTSQLPFTTFNFSIQNSKSYFKERLYLR
jgi:hypothetical protein